MNKSTTIENIAAFLQDNKGSVLATWKGKMSAKEQRAMFGCFIGKGEITIDGEREIIKHSVKVGFGQDYEFTTDCTWNEFAAKVAQGEYK